jgi:MFS family permease
MHPNSETSSRPLHLAIGGLLSLAAAIGIGRFVYTPILPAMIADVPLSQSAAGIIGSANFIGYLLGAVVAGSVWRPRNLRTALLLALASSAATTAAMGLAGSMAAFILLRSAGGAASAFVLVLSSTLILDQLHADGRESLSSVHFAGVGVGIAASAALISALHATSSTWQQMWLFSGLASFVITAGVAALVPNASSVVKAPPAASTPTSRSRVWPLVLAYGLFGFGYVITATFLVAMVRNSPGVQAFEPWIWIAVGLAAIPSVSLWSSLGNRIGILNALGAACFAEAVGVAASVVWMNVWGLFLRDPSRRHLHGHYRAGIDRRATDVGLALAIGLAHDGGIRCRPDRRPRGSGVWIPADRQPVSAVADCRARIMHRRAPELALALGRNAAIYPSLFPRPAFSSSAPWPLRAAPAAPA